MTSRNAVLTVFLVAFAISQTACATSGSSTTSTSSPAASSPVATSPAVAIKPEDQRAATTAVAHFFISCGQQTTASGADRCPQRISPSDICLPFVDSCDVDQPFTWKLVGDPSHLLIYSFSDTRLLQAAGHFMMEVGYRCLDVTGICHDISAGPFMATLKRSGTAMSVADLATGGGIGVPGLSDPGDHAAVLGAVRDFFGTCATAPTSEGAPDCPQAINGGCEPNSATTWTLKRDPTVDARVAWNSAAGVYTVTGTEDFHAASIEPCNDRMVSEDYGGLYWATVVLSDTGPLVINIGGLNNSGCPFC
jgi:hypothetical protein